jgi:hypothetical protein
LHGGEAKRVVSPCLGASNDINGRVGQIMHCTKEALDRVLGTAPREGKRLSQRKNRKTSVKSTLTSVCFLLRKLVNIGCKRLLSTREWPTLIPLLTRCCGSLATRNTWGEAGPVQSLFHDLLLQDVLERDVVCLKAAGGITKLPLVGFSK